MGKEENLVSAVFFQPVLTSSSVPPPTLNEAFVEELKSTGIPFSLEAEDRVFRAHGKASWEETLDTTHPKNYCLIV